MAGRGPPRRVSTPPVRSSTSARKRSCPGRTGPARGFSDGQRVFHEKYGYGTVIASEAGAVEVRFDKSSPKTIMGDYLRPAEHA